MGCGSSQPIKVVEEPPKTGPGLKKPKLGRAGCSFDSLDGLPMHTFNYSYDALDGPVPGMDEPGAGGNDDGKVVEQLPEGKAYEFTL